MRDLLFKCRSITSCLLLLSVPWFASAATLPEKGLMPGELLAGFQDTVNPKPGTPAQAEPEKSGLRIAIIQGDKAANVVDKPAGKVTIEVRDTNNAPVTGAMVTFSAPGDGPGVIFVNGQREASAVTDESGRATIPTATAVNAGAFEYHIKATYQGQEAETTIAQTNYMTAAQAANSGATPAAASKHSTKLLWVVLGVVAVAAGVGAAAFHGGSSSGSAATNPTVTLGAGSGATVGAPHSDSSGGVGNCK